MEPFLLKLGDQTDRTTKQMLQQLIYKRLKYNRYKKTHFFVFTTAFLYGFLIFYFIYKTSIQPFHYSLLDTFSVFFQKSHTFILTFIGIVLFGAIKIIFEKKEKAEKEYHDLRCEIIEKSKDLWKGENWDQRHIVFEQMKKIYNINLYHKSK